MKQLSVKASEIVDEVLLLASLERVQLEKKKIRAELKMILLTKGVFLKRVCAMIFVILIFFKLMSKKPQKSDQGRTKIEHIDQQNEPYIRALQKRIRNLNKKLTEISQLQNKDNLKPEQVEKIQRKPQVLEEIAKIEESLKAFKDVYVENAQHYRNNQLRQLDNLAKAIAIYHFGGEHAEQNKLAQLWRNIEQADKTHKTLNGAVTSISDALKEFANDRKIQKALNSFIEQNGEKEPKANTQEKIANDLVDNILPEVKTEEPPAKVESRPEPEPVVEEKKPEPVAEKTPEVIVEKEPTPIASNQPAQDAKEVAQENGQTEEKKGDGRRGRGGENRDRPYKPRGDGQGRRPPREGGDRPPRERRERPEGERRQYKPKYEEKKAEGAAERSDSLSSSSSEEVRQFKKDEILKLEDEGFTVVGKPKPKAKDPKEVHRYHDRQHGKKFHHHGGPKNS